MDDACAPTLAALVERCAVIDPDTPCHAVDVAFGLQWSSSSVIVAGPHGQVGIVERASFLQVMAGRYGYGRSLWGRRPISALTAWDRPTTTPTTTVAQAAELLVSHRDGYHDLPVLDDAGRPIGFVRPIQVMRALADQTSRRVNTDELTGALSRARLIELLDLRLRELDDAPGLVVLAFLDLDRLKPVNDLFGHTFGDALLRSVVRRLRAGLVGDDLVGRLGGDEFAVVRRLPLSPERAKTASRELGEHLRSILAATDPDLPAEVESSASIGVAFSDRAGTTSSELLRQADEAMYAAKLAGGNRVSLAEESPGDGHRVDTTDLVVVYQPVVDAATGRPVAAEALLRVRQPDGSLGAPANRLAAAARLHTSLDLDCWVLEQTCRTVADWSRQLGPAAPARVHVNLAPESLRHPDVADRLLDAIAHTGADPSRICLELSEFTCVDDIDDAAGKLDRLQAAGFTLAVDDVGATVGTLRLLDQVHRFDCLKIDRSVTARAGIGAAFDTELLALVVRIAARLDMDVVAEGVETESEHDTVVAQGITQLQGFRFGRPMIEDAFVDCLAVRPATDGSDEPIGDRL